MICIPDQILFAWLNQGEWDGQDIGIYRGEEKYIQGLDEETYRKEPLGRPTCRWKNNIKIHLIEIGWNGVDWINLA